MTLRSPINSYKVSILLIQSVASFPIGGSDAFIKPVRALTCRDGATSHWMFYIALNCRGACPFLAFFTLLG
jgi:hypothetical protein